VSLSLPIPDLNELVKLHNIKIPCDPNLAFESQISVGHRLLLIKPRVV